MATIRTRICSKLIPAVEIVQNRVRSDGGDAISVSDGKVNVSIIKSGMSGCKAIVKTSIVPETVDYDADEWFPCLGMEAEFNWYRGINSTPTGIFTNRDTHLTLVYNHPDDPCHWIFTRILGRRLALENNILYKSTSPATDGGPIPQADDEEWYDGEDGFEGQWMQCSFVPGEYLQLQWISKYGNEVKAAIVAGIWFETPAFTGGKITNITGDGASKLISVQSPTGLVTCLPSDFAGYAVGDWIYLLKQGDSDATATNRTSSYGSSSNASSGSSTEVSKIVSDILALVNSERAFEGLPPLTISATLTRASDKHTKDMAKNNFTSHTGSDGSTSETRIKDTGYMELGEVTAIGENVASGHYTAESVMAGWMASPGHRENILREDFTAIGISVAYGEDDDGYDGDDGLPYYTQDFGSLDDSVITVVDPDYRVVPVRFNEYGPGANGDIETIDYKLDDSLNFSDSFEVSQHIGVITELWPQDVTPLRDAAKITIEGLYPEQAYWVQPDEYVDIFYHCEGSETIEDGIAAFEVGDEVLVLNEGGNPNPTADDLVIIGFKDELKSCISYLIRFQSGNEIVLWDVKTQDIFELPEVEPGEDPYSYPLTTTQLSALIGELSLVHEDSWSTPESVATSSIPNFYLDGASMPCVESYITLSCYGGCSETYCPNYFVASSYGSKTATVTAECGSPGSGWKEIEMSGEEAYTGAEVEIAEEIINEQKQWRMTRSGIYDTNCFQQTSVEDTYFWSFRKLLNNNKLTLNEVTKSCGSFYDYESGVTAEDGVGWFTEYTNKNIFYVSDIFLLEESDSGVPKIAEVGDKYTHGQYPDTYSEVNTNTPLRTLFMDKFGIVVEQPIIELKDTGGDIIETWGQCKCGIVLKDSEGVFDWDKMQEVDTDLIWDNFSVSFAEDVEENGTDAGFLSVSVYSKS